MNLSNYPRVKKKEINLKIIVISALMSINSVILAEFVGLRQKDDFELLNNKIEIMRRFCFDSGWVETFLNVGK